MILKHPVLLAKLLYHSFIPYAQAVAERSQEDGDLLAGGGASWSSVSALQTPLTQAF